MLIRVFRVLMIHTHTHTHTMDLAICIIDEEAARIQLVTSQDNRSHRRNQDFAVNVLDELVPRLRLGQTSIIQLHNSTDVNLAAVLVLSGVFKSVTFRSNVLPSSSRVANRLDPVISVTRREILERKTDLLRYIRFIHLDRVSEHFERPLQQKDIFTRVVLGNSQNIPNASTTSETRRWVIYNFSAR